MKVARAFLLGCALCVGATASAAAGPEDPPGAVKDGEEVVDLDALDEPGDSRPTKATVTRVPEHDYDRRLIVFPLLLVAILAWNVKWKPDPVVKKPAALPRKEGSQ